MNTAPAALERALRDAALVVVQAPAGYGKTTSVRAALDGARNVAWYDAQPWEADGFVAPLVDRVRTVRPDVGRVTLGLAEEAAVPEHLGATFADELRHVAAPLTIVRRRRARARRIVSTVRAESGAADAGIGSSHASDP